MASPVRSVASTKSFDSPSKKPACSPAIPGCGSGRSTGSPELGRSSSTRSGSAETSAVIRVAVAGASGYMGAELLRLLLRHPEVELTAVTSDRLAGELLARAYPPLRGLTELAFSDLDPGRLAVSADAVFLALPHMESQKAVPVLRRH